MSTGQPSDRRLVADRYLLAEPLDARGRLFRARDRRDRRTVVLEWLATPMPREVAAVCRLRHPNIAAALEAGDDRSVPFLVREYVEGTDLGRIVRDRGPMALGQAVDVAIQAARGLEAAHRVGIVHGDLRPSRLILDAGGTLRLLGLGISGMDGTAPARRPAPGDATPERLADPGRGDPRDDIDSLGCVLYFLLTGRAPFDVEAVGDRSTAPTLRVPRPDVPTALDELARQMMARRPSDRPASMTEVLERLESCREAILGGAVPPGSSARESPAKPAPRAGHARPRTPAVPLGREGSMPGRREEPGGVPIGPEFSLEGLGIDARPRTAPGPSSRPTTGRAIPLPLTETSRPGPASRLLASRVGRPAIVLGLLALAAVGTLALRSRLHPGTDRRSAAPGSTSGVGGPSPERPKAREPAANPPPPPEAEWTSRAIFDGRSPRSWMLTNRRPLPRKHVQPDGLNPHGTGSYLVAFEQKLGDFILDFDYKLTRGCNTGVFLRVGDLDDPVHTGLEVSLQDSGGTGVEDPGAIYGLVAPSVNAQKPAGEWNHLTITARGPVIAVSLNGKEVSRINLDEWTDPGRKMDGGATESAREGVDRIPRTGYLGFQDLVGDCWFRDIVLRMPTRP